MQSISQAVWALAADGARHKETFAHTTNNSTGPFGQHSLWDTERISRPWKIWFLSLLNSQQFQTYMRKFPQTAFFCLTKSHGSLFDLSGLKTELTVMYVILKEKFQLISLISLRRKIWVRAWDSITHWHVWQWLSLCPLLLQSAHSLPWSESECTQETPLDRLGFQH